LEPRFGAPKKSQICHGIPNLSLHKMTERDRERQRERLLAALKNPHIMKKGSEETNRESKGNQSSEKKKKAALQSSERRRKLESSAVVE